MELEGVQNRVATFTTRSNTYRSAMEFDEFTISLLVSGLTPNSDALQDAHLAHLASLHDAGSLLAGGPLSDPVGELRGLSILNVPVDGPTAEGSG